jgi:triacylglycerol lipase
MKSGVKNYTADESLKYPVVLVHGIIAHDRRSCFNFWGRIPKIFGKKGIKVYLGNTDSWGSYDSNAKILKSTIEKILQKEKTEKVNIIAHSKGGIDSRYLIWNYGFQDKVASLTTISTPHHGSALADLIYSKKAFHSETVKKVLDIFGKLYGDTNPDLRTVTCQLTTNKMKEFNAHIEKNENVYYQSLYTTMKNSFDDLMFFHCHRYLKNISGENDGFVNENSAKWGDNIYKIEGAISHAEILDYKMKNIFGINIPDIYIKIAEKLSKNGF